VASPRSDHRRLLDLADAIITTCANSGLVSRSVYPVTVGPTARTAGLFRPGPLGLLLGERPGRWGPKPLPGGQLAGLTHRVFVGGEVSLDVSFTAAQARLANLIGGGLLVSASAQAYSDGITGLAGVGPLGSALDLSRLCQVQFQDLKARGDSARFALRWEVTGPGGGLFPALDADITLTPARKHSTTLTLTGVYRTPLGTVGVELDWVIWHGAATATIEAFLRLLAEALAAPAWAAEPAAKADHPDPDPMPPEPRTP
jgi:hypothetical protein